MAVEQYLFYFYNAFTNPWFSCLVFFFLNITACLPKWAAWGRDGNLGSAQHSTHGADGVKISGPPAWPYHSAHPCIAPAGCRAGELPSAALANQRTMRCLQISAIPCETHKDVFTLRPWEHPRPCEHSTEAVIKPKRKCWAPLEVLGSYSHANIKEAAPWNRINSTV